MAPAFLQCESHPGRLLTEHLRDVVSRIRRSAPDCRCLEWVALFHDLGKATEFFQRYLHGRDSPQRLRRHADLGALWLLEYLSATMEAESGLPVVDAALAFLFVRRHHGRLDDLCDTLADLQPADVEVFATQLQTMDCTSIQEWLASELNDACAIPRVEPHDRKRTGLRVKLILELKKHCPSGQAMRRFQHALKAFGQFIEADRDSAAGYDVDVFDPPLRFTSHHVAQFRRSFGAGNEAHEPIAVARNLVYQSAVSKIACRPTERGGLWTLTVPTGSGKTLAAIGWALKRREARTESGMPSCPIIYALPFTSIIDQNADVIRRLWTKPDCDESLLAVHHHLAELGDIARSGEESLARSWVEGWRADIVSTTFVQVSHALFHGTAADARRFARLAGAILILDEVQAIPAELWPVFRTALRSLCENFNTDVLLVTATQPAFFDAGERLEIGPGPLPKEIARAFNRYDLRAELSTPLGPTAVRQRIVEEMAAGQAKSCLVILNTIREALELHSLINSDPRLEDYRLFHLSTNLRPKDRRRILAEVTTCIDPHILVATQVVEAGVDVSFDIVVRAIAPLDAIIQAAGRCNRHGSGARGRVIVFVPEGNSAIAIYGALHISLAQQMLERVMRAAANGWIAEPDLTRTVDEYFSTLDGRIQKDTASKVHEAIGQLQFAALRGEGQDRECHLKRVQLIEDRNDRIPHFIETDDSDTAIWESLTEALAIADTRRRRARLRSLRNEVAQRVVEVPPQFQFGSPSTEADIVRVPRDALAQWYSINTGWKR